MTQREKVVEKIERDGEVNNFWAIENYILRLGAIIYALRKDGMRLKGIFGKELGKDKPLWKNYYYIKEEKTDKKCGCVENAVCIQCAEFPLI